MASTSDRSPGTGTAPPPGRPEPHNERHERHERHGSDERHEAWRPRVVQDHPFNVFETDHQGPDSVPPPSRIQDPTEETTPLEGTRDHSAEDSLEPDYVATERRPTDAADEDRRLDSPDRHAGSTPGAGDTRGPNDRSKLGR